MKKQILLIVALVASVFTTVNAQVTNGNATTPVTTEKTWDFSSFDNLPAGLVSTACTIDNLYFGVSESTPMWYDTDLNRMVMGYSADESSLSDASTDCVLSFKVPAGEGTLTISGKSAAKARPGIVFLGDEAFREEGDSINDAYNIVDYTYEIRTDKEMPVYVVAENAKAGNPIRKSKGLFVYAMTWTPKTTNAIKQTSVSEAKEVSEYYNVQGMRVVAPKEGALLKKAKNGKVIIL